jgi:hypothetical protein
MFTRGVFIAILFSVLMGTSTALAAPTDLPHRADSPAQQYLKVAAKAAAALKAIRDAYPGAYTYPANPAEMHAALLAFVQQQRAYDASLAAIPFGPRAKRDVFSILLLDSQAESLAERVAANMTSCAITCAAAADLSKLQIQQRVAVNQLRRDLHVKLLR